MSTKSEGCLPFLLFMLVMLTMTATLGLHLI